MAMKQGLAALILFSSLAYAEGIRQIDKVQWSPLLKLESRRTIPSRLAKPFGDVFEGTLNGAKVSISNCNDYLLLAPKGFHLSNPPDFPVLNNDGVDCVTLNMLRTAKASQHGRQASFELDASSLALLPPELAPAASEELVAKGKAADLAGESWGTYTPAASAAATADQLIVKQPDWETTVTIYARGDFSGSGHEQLLIRCDYAAVNGSMRTSKLFMLAPAKARLRFVRQITVR